MPTRSILQNFTHAEKTFIEHVESTRKATFKGCLESDDELVFEDSEGVFLIITMPEFINEDQI